MNNAFIFDMDGVVVDSESLWEKYEQIFLPKLIGKEIYLKIKGQVLGNSVSAIYALACNYGCEVDKDKFERVYDTYAEEVYKKAKITEGLELFIEELKLLKYKIGLVSSSRKYWITLVLNKLSKKSKFEFVLSLDSGNTKPKPSPDGYVEAMRVLGSQPNSTVILEDSQRGVEAGKASGAFTICLKTYLPKEYSPEGADMYIKSFKELTNIVRRI